MVMTFQFCLPIFFFPFNLLQATVFLTRVNRTSYRLNLNTWSSGGCPILESKIEHRNIRQKHWTTINIDSLTEPIFLNNLIADQFYKIKVTMKNTAGMTSVEYEIRMTDSKAVNVFHKSLSQPESFNPDLISIGNYNTYSSDYEVGPGHMTVTLIVTLTLLLTLLAAVAILYRTIQKKLFSYPEGDSCSPELQTPIPRNKMPFLQNNMTLTHEQQLQAQLSGNYVHAPSELAILRTTAGTLDRRLHSNKLKNSSSDSAFNVLTTFNSEIPLEAAYQYLTVARRHPPPTGSGPPPPPSHSTVPVDQYSIIQKSTRPLKTTNRESEVVQREPRDRSIPRYCTPNLLALQEQHDMTGVSLVGCSGSPKRIVAQPPQESDTHHGVSLSDCHHHCQFPQDWNQEEDQELQRLHERQLRSQDHETQEEDREGRSHELRDKHPPQLLTFCNQMMNERIWP